MLIPAITAQNNSTNFNAIYKPQGVKFNPAQENIFNTIKTALREPLKKFRGQTAEDFYKSKNIDFEISPAANDSVFVKGYKKLREIGVGKDKAITYSDSICIGEYDKKSTFNVSDIDKKIKERSQDNLAFSLIMLLAPAVLLALFIGKCTRTGFKTPNEVTKPLIEHFYNIQTSKVQDTIKIFKHC